MMTNSLIANNQAHHRRITGVLRQMPWWLVQKLGSSEFRDAKDQYMLVQRRIDKLANALDAGWTHTHPDGTTETIDWNWFSPSMLHAAVPRELIEGCDLTIDGTAVPTFGRLKISRQSIELDGEYDPNDENAAAHQEEAARLNKKRPRDLPVGYDGRYIYTKDVGARAGYRTATGKQSSGLYCGRELHLGIAVKPLEDTDGYSLTRFGRSVPAVIIGAALVPAGTNRNLATMGFIADAVANNTCSGVIADPGYTNAEYHHSTINNAYGVPTTSRPVSHQLGVRNGPGATLVVDGHPFSEHTPQELLNLKPPGYDATKEERAKSAALFTLRAKYYRYVLNGTNRSGTRRIRNPLGEKIKSDAFPGSERLPSTAPRVIGATADCCARTATIGEKEFPLMQRTLAFTEAWNDDYARRNLTETTNSYLKGSFIDVSPGFMRLLDSAKIHLYMAIALAGVNAHIMRNWNDHPEVTAIDLDKTPGEPWQRVQTVDIVAPDNAKKTRDLAEQIRKHSPQIGRDFNLLT